MAFLHIDPLGNDTTGDGSQALPYATPSKAHSVSVPSGTVYYHAGTYNILLEQDLAINGAANQFITHQPYVSGGNIDTVILDGALGVFSSTQNIIRLSGNRIIFDGIQRGKMTLRNNPGGRGISINSSQFCQIKNLIVHNVQERPIGGGGHNYLIENCEVYQGGLGHVSGIVAAWPGGIAPTSLGTGILASNITITGCYVHDHWGEGIILLRATGITVIGNVVHDCFSVGIYIDKAIVGIVDSNYIFTSNPGYVRAGIGNMRLINIAQEGVAVFNPNREIRIRNNILAGGSTALRYFQDATTGTVFNYYAGIHIDHNTIWRPDGYAFDFDNVTAPNPEPTGNAFRNNIVFKGTGGSMVMNASDYAGMLFQNNCFADFTPTFATGTNSIFNTNPNLINPALSGSVNGFAVNFLSVVARAGLNLTSTIPRDFFGKTRSSTPTIGAYEVPPPPTGTNDTYTVAKNTLLTQAASPLWCICQ